MEPRGQSQRVLGSFIGNGVNSTTRYLAFGLLGVGLLGALWVVTAQEGGPLFGPPPVFPTESAEKKGPVKLPAKTPSLKDKKKADPTLIVPPEAFEAPRPIEGTRGYLTDDSPGIVLVQGIAPLPSFPPMEKLEPKPAGGLPPLPTLEPMAKPAPTVEPTKLLLVEPKGFPAKKPAAPEIGLPSPPVLIAPALELDVKKPMAAPGPLLGLPEIKPPPVMTMPAVTMPPVEKPRRFVRIESASNDIAFPPVSTEQVPGEMTLPPPPGNVDTTGSIAHAQTPSVTAQKHGARVLRAGETQAYQIVVRNLGPGVAQNVRIEEELPAGVRVVSADPAPTMQVNKLIWVLPAIGVQQEQTLRMTLQSPAEVDGVGRLSVHTSTTGQTTTTSMRAVTESSAFTVHVAGPSAVAVGASASFEIRVTNASTEPIRGLTLFGYLPEGLSHPESREIKAILDELTIAPGEAKTLKMPATAVKTGRYPVAVKVVTRLGEARASTTIEVTGSALHLQQGPATRLFLGRDGELRLEVTNNTGRHLRHIDVADRLPEGLAYVGASDSGLYQGHTRTVFWHLPDLPIGVTKSLIIRVNGTKAGQHQNVVFARADGVPETQCSGVVTLEGNTDVTLRVVDLHNPLELGKETVYEITVQNRGSLLATNVGLQLKFPPGLTPKKAEGKSRFAMDRHSIVFEPIGELLAQGQVVYRVSAIALAPGDQRVRFSVTCDQVQLPIEREISTRVVP